MPIAGLLFLSTQLTSLEHQQKIAHSCDLACSVVQVCGLIFTLKEIDRARVMGSARKGNCLVSISF